MFSIWPFAYFWCRKQSQNVFYWRSFLIKVLFHQRSSWKIFLPFQVVFNKNNCIPSKVVFNQRYTSIKCCLLSKIIFRLSLYKKMSSIKGLSLMVLLPSNAHFINGRLSSKVLSHQRLSSIKGCLLFFLYQMCSRMFWNVPILLNYLKTC